MKRDTEFNRSELHGIREAQKKNASNTETLAKLTGVRFDANQRTILRTQDEHKTALEQAQQAVIADIEKKLTREMQQVIAVAGNHTVPNPTNQDTYAQRAARPPPNNNPPNKDQPIPKYVSMERRASNTRPPTTQTNGALSRLYVKDLRSEPVGLVK